MSLHRPKCYKLHADRQPHRPSGALYMLYISMEIPAY
jgi:hypothetical protein